MTTATYRLALFTLFPPFLFLPLVLFTRVKENEEGTNKSAFNEQVELAVAKSHIVTGFARTVESQMPCTFFSNRGCWEPNRRERRLLFNVGAMLTASRETFRNSRSRQQRNNSLYRVLYSAIEWTLFPNFSLIATTPKSPRVYVDRKKDNGT